MHVLRQTPHLFIFYNADKLDMIRAMSTGTRQLHQDTLLGECYQQHTTPNSHPWATCVNDLQTFCKQIQGPAWTYWSIL